MLSLNFHPVTKAAKTSHGDIIVKAEMALSKAAEYLNRVYRNQHYQMARDNSHRAILQNTELKIRWAGAAKLVLIVTLAIIQLCMMKRFLGKTDLSYQPV